MSANVARRALGSDRCHSYRNVCILTESGSDGNPPRSPRGPSVSGIKHHNTKGVRRTSIEIRCSQFGCGPTDVACKFGCGEEGREGGGGARGWHRRRDLVTRAAGRVRVCESTAWRTSSAPVENLGDIRGGARTSKNTPTHPSVLPYRLTIINFVPKPQQRLRYVRLDFICRLALKINWDKRNKNGVGFDNFVFL